MPKQPVLKPREIIKVLEKIGFVLDRQKGSHCLFVKDDKIVTVPFHNKDLKPKTLKTIIKQAGLTVEEVIKTRK